MHYKIFLFCFAYLLQHTIQAFFPKSFNNLLHLRLFNYSTFCKSKETENFQDNYIVIYFDFVFSNLLKNKAKMKMCIVTIEQNSWIIECLFRQSQVPQSIKKIDNFTIIFTNLGSVRVKALLKTVMKLNTDGTP